MGKEAVIDINSCNADKILQVFEEIGNYIGSNANEVSHQVQQAFTSQNHYDWLAAIPVGPQELQVKTKPVTEGSEPTNTKVAPEDVPKSPSLLLRCRRRAMHKKG